MKTRALQFLLPAVTMLFLAAPPVDRAQDSSMGRARDFTSESYFEPPHEQQVKMKLSGADASPLPDGLMDVKQLHIELFAVDGKRQLVVRAPQCTYSPLDGLARSSGRLELQTGDGQFRLEGEGFLWQQGDSSLTISNHVHTVIQSVNFLKFSAP